MLMRRVSAKEKVNNGLVRAALVAGVASAVAVGSLSGVGPANGTCIGISGINIPLGGGGGCNSTFGTFALGLGPNTVADASGGFLNGAIAVGTNVAAFAEGSGFSVANLALNFGTADTPINPTTGVPTPGTAYSRVTAGPGFLNLGANLGGSANAGGGGASGPTPIDIRASGVASSAINIIGNRNSLTSSGILANSTVLGSFGDPNGSDNVLTSTGPLSVAFVRQGFFSEECLQGPCGNTVTASGFGAIAGALNTVHRVVEQTGFGINIATPGNDVGSTAAPLAARNSFAPTTFAGGSSNKSGNQLSGSLTKGSKQFSSSLKNLGDGVKNALSGLGKKKQTSEPKKTDGDD